MLLLIPPSIARFEGDLLTWAGVVSARGTRRVEAGAWGEKIGCAVKRGAERGGRTDSGRDEGGLFSASED